mmetsp:Transcript_10591/g.24181  ORF Transcript_10591/g.24181 Transcript_10591/m.24181 type:complete len:140 (+) Transcript_10591:803-1222(+)
MKPSKRDRVASFWGATQVHSDKFITCINTSKYLSLIQLRERRGTSSYRTSSLFLFLPDHRFLNASTKMSIPATSNNADAEWPTESARSSAPISGKSSFMIEEESDLMSSKQKTPVLPSSHSHVFSSSNHVPSHASWAKN